MEFERWKVGEVTITKVPELGRIPGMKGLLPDATPDALREIAWLAPHFVLPDMKMTGSIHALIVETRARRIMVDTCVGNDKERSMEAWNKMQGPFLSHLMEAGYARDSIDTVLCTHLHVDHVGWNTVWEGNRWAPTFPKAKYLFGEREFDHWSKEAESQEEDVLDTAKVLADSVQPVLDAGLAQLVDVNHTVCDEVRLVPTAGHTPGHVSILIESQGESAFITGDIMHHPCQIARPHWPADVDVDPQQSTQTRRDVLTQFADTPTLVIGTHFATPTAGRIVRDGDSYRLDV